MQMNRKFLLAAICSTLISSVSFADSLEEVTKKIDNKLEEVKSIKSDVKMTMKMNQGGQNMSMTMDGKMSGAHRDEKYYSRMQATMNMEMNMGGQAQKMDGKMLQVTDGEYTWIEQEMSMMPTKQVMKRKIDDVPSIGGAYIEKLKEDNELSLGEDATVDGKECWVIIAKPKNQDPMAPPVDKIKFYHRKDDGVMTKMEGMNPDGEVFMTMNMTNIEINPSVSESDFKYEVPEGVNVMDMSGA